MWNRSMSSARLTALLPITILCVLASCSPALALGDWVGVEVAPWKQDLEGTVSIDSGAVSGTRIDLQDTLDIDPEDTAKVGRVWFRLSKTRLIFDYADTSRSGTSTVAAPGFFFNGDPFLPGDTVTTDLDIKLLQGQFRQTFLDLKVFEIGAGFGLNMAQVDMVLDGCATCPSTLDEDVPFPTLNLGVAIKPFPGFHIRVEANGMSAKVSGTSVDILDARAQIEFYFAHVVGVFAGYRTFRFTIDDDDFGQIDSTFDGPYLGLGLKF
jgi:hypothetical protein